MEIFKPGIRIDFLSLSKPFMMVSLLLVVGSWVAVATLGMNLGIDFAGGSEAVLEFKEGIDVAKLKEDMTAAGLDAPEVVKFGIRDGDEGKYFLRTRTVSLLTEVEREKVKGSLESALGKPKNWDASAEMGNVIRVQYETEKTHQSLKDAAVKAGL